MTKEEKHAGIIYKWLTFIGCDRWNDEFKDFFGMELIYTPKDHHDYMVLSDRNSSIYIFDLCLVKPIWKEVHTRVWNLALKDKAYHADYLSSQRYMNTKEWSVKRLTASILWYGMHPDY